MPEISMEHRFVNIFIDRSGFSGSLLTYPMNGATYSTPQSTNKKFCLIYWSKILRLSTVIMTDGGFHSISQKQTAGV